MIKTTETEFYSKKATPNESEMVPIDGYEIPKDFVFCRNCKFYKEARFDYDGYDIPEECRHKENKQYTYNHKGKQEHRAWKPKEKNKKLKCELYKEKKNILKRIAIKFGFYK